MMMMSSEEETDCVVMQERLLKKSKRTRQRVDAGEPRNSYASIPNFSSRPNTSSTSSSGVVVLQPPPQSLLQLAATVPSAVASVSMLHHSHILQQQQQLQQQHLANNNNGYNFLGSPVHGVVSGVCSSSPPFVSSCPGNNTLVGGGGGGGSGISASAVVPTSASIDLKGGLLVVQTEHSPPNSSSSVSAGQRLHHHHHHHHHHNRHHNRQQQHHRSVSFDMGSDGEGKPSRDGGGELRLNGTSSTSIKETEVAAPTSHHHPNSLVHNLHSSDDNSLLLREILQGGGGKSSMGDVIVGGGGGGGIGALSPSSTSTSPVYNLLSNGKGGNNNSESIICHLLKNASSGHHRKIHHHNRNNNKKDANNIGTKDDGGENEEEIEDEDEDNSILRQKEEEEEEVDDDDDDDDDEEVDREVYEEREEEEEEEEGRNLPKKQQQQQEVKQAGTLLRGSSSSQESGTISTTTTTEEVVDCGRKLDIISKEHLLQQKQKQKQKQQHHHDIRDNDAAAAVDDVDDDDDLQEEDDENAVEDEEDYEGGGGAISKTLNLCNRNRRLCSSSSTMNQVVDETFIESASASVVAVTAEIEEIEEVEKERVSRVTVGRAATSEGGGGGRDDEVDDEEEDEEIDEDRRPLSPDSPGSSSLRYKLKGNNNQNNKNKSNVTSTLSFGTSSSSSSSAELKRARVENIISSMRSSPSRPSTVEVPQVNGCKKRKLYMPQQHEAIRMANALAAAAALSPPPRDLLLCMDDELLGPVPCKQRRAEQDLLRQQLTQMQSQIAAIQHKLDLYEGPSSDSDVVGSSQSDDGQPDVIPVQNEARNGSPRVGVGRAIGSSPPPLLFHLGFGAGRDERGGSGRGGGPGSTTICKPSTPDLEPAHFIDEARRLVSEQERLTKEVDTCKMMMTASSAVAVTASASPAEPKVAATAAAAAAAVAAASGPVPRPPSAVIPPDWESLADILKLGMSSLIDDWVRRCASKPTSCLPSAAELGSSSSSNSKEHATQQQSAHLPPPHTSTTSSSSTPLSSSSSSSMMAASSVAVTSVVNSMHLQSDRRSPRTKVIDRGRMGSMGGGVNSIASSLAHLPPPSAPNMAALFGSSTNFAELHLKPPHVTAAMFPPPKPPMPIYVSHPSPHHSLSFYGQTPSHGGGGGGGDSPEQSEALPLVVTPKKKRHKVTDTRITPRTVSRLLGHQDHLSGSGGGGDGPKYSLMGGGGGASPVEGGGYHHHPPPIVPVSLPTSVAIPNPSLHQSDVFSPYPYYHHGPHHPRGSPHSDGMMDEAALLHPSHPAAQHHHHHAAAVALHSSLFMGGGHAPSPETLQQLTNQLKAENGGDSSDCNSGTDLLYDPNLPTSSTLTPMHLRKAKLMFFYVRYPSSAILKTFFPDIKFNKNNTAQLVKWFSNFREFFYIQMEKYARQALSEGCKGAEELTVTVDSELYRVLNLHYNRNNHIEVPSNFRYVVEQTLREFFKSIMAGKDQEQSWKKSIYKVIARMDDNVPDYFKSPNFLEQLE